MIFNSIRWRLQVWHGLILVLVLAGFGFTAYQVARDNQLRRIDQDLDQHLMAVLRPQPPARLPDHPPDWPPDHPDQRPESRRNEPRNERRFGSPDFLRQAREAIQQNGVLDAGQTNTFYYVLWQLDGSVLARSPGAPADVPGPAPGMLPGPPVFPARDVRGTPRPPELGPSILPVARSRGQLREVMRVMPEGNRILVGRSIAADLAAMRRLALWLIAAGTAVLLLGLAGGWWVATRAIRPIEAISTTAVKIAGGDLSQRINAADTDSELGRLAGVLNSTFARLEAAFAQQARFTSDASHELRTPVSVILTQTQTALSRTRTGPEYPRSPGSLPTRRPAHERTHPIPPRTGALGRRPGADETRGL